MSDILQLFVAGLATGAIYALAAIGFTLLFLVTGPRSAGSRWFEVGSASADLIWRGAWWRAITALTLHADLLHLAGNVVAPELAREAMDRAIQKLPIKAKFVIRHDTEVQV